MSAYVVNPEKRRSGQKRNRRGRGLPFPAYRILGDIPSQAEERAARDAKRVGMLARRAPSTPIRFEDFGGPKDETINAK